MRPALLALACCALLAPGCYRPSPEDTGRVGRDGWLLYLEKPGEYLTAVHNHDSFTVRARNPGTFLIEVQPRNLAFPLPPGAQYQSGTYQVYQQGLIYTIPPGRTFADIYEWYRAWFAFGRAPAGAAARPDRDTR